MTGKGRIRIGYTSTRSVGVRAVRARSTSPSECSAASPELANRSTSRCDREPAYVQALIRTVVAFERAIALRRPLPYDGDVFMLNPAFASALAASIAGIRAVARDTRRAAAETG
jgi:hypothetical protein